MEFSKSREKVGGDIFVNRLTQVCESVKLINKLDFKDRNIICMDANMSRGWNDIMRRNNRVSKAVIRRLPRYYRYLTELKHKGMVRISSSALGKAMGLTASQIRQDLFCFGEFGQQGYGYKVDNLRDEIAEIMGITQGHTAIILGAGNLGRALMENFRFGSYGFQVTAAFDVNEHIIGQAVGGIPILHINTLEQYLQENSISVGVLTVPKLMAHPIAERLVGAGVKGIWNFTNVELNLFEDDVVVESVHFSDSLLALSYMISERTKPKNA